ncbi:MAG: DUF3788 family protein [Clostridiales bacterium]|jgi:hypothetical protein|nr:DUF3788 family protein [Clostridiales bacterium]
MTKKGEQLLRNPDIEPTSVVLAEALGNANNAYLTFADKLTEHEIQLQWRYYTDGKAWLAKGVCKWTGKRGGQNEATVFWLSVWEGFFKVTFYFPEKARADAECLPVDEETKQMIADSKQMGKMKFFPLAFEIDSDEQLEAVFTIAEFKKSIK